MPWHVQIVPAITTPDATVGTWGTFSFTDNLVFPFVNPSGMAGGATAVANTSGAQNDAWAVDVVLGAGTWNFHIWVRESTNTGIITLQQDGVSMGTVDTYAAAAAAAKLSITGWTVAAAGKKRMNLLAATKNGSSAGYFMEFFGIEFRRTA